MTEQQELELLRQEIAALRSHAKQLNTMLGAALCALREANGMVGDEYMRRRDAERKLAGLKHLNMTCAALGIQPVFTEN